MSGHRSRYSEETIRKRFRDKARQALFVLCMVTLMLGICACGDASSSEAASGGASDQSAKASGESYDAPDFKGSSFHEGDASSGAGASIDTSKVSDGYVAVSASSSSRLKFQVIKGEDTYNYDIDSGGDPSVFPLQCGNGTYQFRVMENITGSKYAELYSTSADVSLSDEFQPFLRPSDYVDYAKDSACVKKAAEISAKAGSAMDVVSGVYDYITKGVTYDTDKAKTVESGYLPAPDETMKSGKGICFDYASLAAAMLRSQGIPTKVIFGYVAPDDLYHAWNMFYTKETGWVTVDYKVSGDSWNRLDLTFAAGGADSDFIGDGSHYSDVYFY
ncbi:MAG: transglutaminase domain-containing protein [Firmicutes bacterium]|nr:transglutaminase domain-containing protein [Bacillota bacterium]